MRCVRRWRDLFAPEGGRNLVSPSRCERLLFCSTPAIPTWLRAGEIRMLHASGELDREAEAVTMAVGLLSLRRCATRAKAEKVSLTHNEVLKLPMTLFEPGLKNVGYLDQNSIGAQTQSKHRNEPRILFGTQSKLDSSP